MRAAVVSSYGDAPAAGEFNDPVAGEGEVACEVELAALNPVDRLIASGTFAHGAPPLPYVPGREGIARLEKGGLAWFDMPMPPFGSLAERVLLPEGSMHRLPEGLSPDRALACGIAGMAAWFSLVRRAKLESGERVLILGAGGVVGQVGLVTARKLGARRVVAAMRDPAALKGDADAVVEIAGTRSEIADRIREAFGGEGPDVVLDPVWGVPAEAAAEAMQFNGRLVQLGQSAGTEATFSSTTIRNKCLHLMGHTNFAFGQEEKSQALGELFSWAAAGDLDVPCEVTPLDRVGEAWERQGSSPGVKLAIDPHG